MSDSEDDKPLAARAIPVKSSSAAVPSKPASASDRTGQASTSAAQDPLKRKAAQKASVVDDSDSEDDKPLGARAKPSKPPRPGNSLRYKFALWALLCSCLLRVLKLPWMQGLAGQASHHNSLEAQKQ